MNRASPVDLRKSLEIANHLAHIGIRFVPIPVATEEEFQTLAAELSRRLEQMAVEAEKNEGGAACTLSLNRLKELLLYDPDTGIFTWISSTKNYRRPIGAVAGYINSLGYVQIGIDCVAYGAHRLAWMYVHGNLPEMDVDHINGNPSDNRMKI